jgi:hypothetical protein
LFILYTRQPGSRTDIGNRHRHGRTAVLWVTVLLILKYLQVTRNQVSEFVIALHNQAE